jgi:putative phosphoribosyl transferase
VGAPESCSELSEVADEVVCAAAPEPFYAVGLWYRRFSQTTDEEVVRLLAGSAEASRAASAGGKR